ncbi:MAG: ATPase domain-containing protein [Phycisphaerales bacterium]
MESKKSRLVLLDISTLHDLVGQMPESRRLTRKLASLLLHILEETHLCLQYGASACRLFSQVVFQPLDLARTFLASSGIPDHHLKYSVKTSIRKHYACVQSAEMAELFRAGANALNEVIAHTVLLRISKQKLPLELFRERLWTGVQRTPVIDTEQRRVFEARVDLFLECCRMVGYLTASSTSGSIAIHTRDIDAEYLLSNLFGLPTNLRGFDELFGGGGLMLTENSSSGGLQLPGRTVLVTGRPGTGKSLLSLQLAIEVAQKGGLAWVMPLEQSVHECLYVLRSILPARSWADIRVAGDSQATERVLLEPSNGKGTLIILKTLKESFESFLSALSANADRIKDYALRLIVVDPINSVISSSGESLTALRGQLVDTITKIESKGTNVLLIGEDNKDPEATDHPYDDYGFVENIADTVIRLSIQKRYDYAQRYFEICKSRLQREQRGEHPFSIVAGEGITLYPSASAVLARTLSRDISPAAQPIEFAFGALDEILGKRAILEGDVIVLAGDKGCLKTHIGIFFLTGGPRKVYETSGAALPTRSLLVAARDSEAAILHLLANPMFKRDGARTKGDILVCSIPRGHVKPGQVFNLLEDEFLTAHLAGYRIDRVMVDNVTHWDMSCPFMAEDPTFGDTLVEFLRRRGVTSLIVTGDLENRGSRTQEAIVDDADCVLGLTRFEFRGGIQVLGRIHKTRTMKHKQDAFEIHVNKGRLEIRPCSLLRVIGPREVKPIEIHLFLHSESDLQAEYNRRIVHAMKASLLPSVNVESPSRLYDLRAAKLGHLSGLDQVQVLQLDEFQVRLSSPDEHRILLEFPGNLWDDSYWGDYLPSVAARIRPRSRNKAFVAIPFYQNVGLLVYRSDNRELSRLCSHSGVYDTSLWKDLAAVCEQWEQEHVDRTELFFDFPLHMGENYNCFFFEVLASLSPVTSLSTSGSDDFCPLRAWFSTQTAIEAGKIYRTLCRRTHRHRGRCGRVDSTGRRAGGASASVSKSALLWRHWYTTLNQMMYEMSSDQRSEIAVRLLPNGVSVAGEWYLGVPTYSAAPEAGLEIIRLMTSREAELNRLRLGVGLPTRREFYATGLSGDDCISPYFSADIREVGCALEGTKGPHLRRSDFGCYSDLSQILTFYLQQIIEIPDGDVPIADRIARVFAGFEKRMGFIRSTNRTCKLCCMRRTIRSQASKQP